MKKILLTALAAVVLISCNTTETPEEPRTVTINGTEYLYLDGNTAIEEEELTNDMLFAGTSTVTQSSTYVQDNLLFEIVESDDNTVILYMYNTQFAETMPAMTMRTVPTEYLIKSSKLECSADTTVPEFYVPAMSSYMSDSTYTMSNFSIQVAGTKCEVVFTCMGYEVIYEGELVIENK